MAKKTVEDQTARKIPLDERLIWLHLRLRPLEVWSFGDLFKAAIEQNSESLAMLKQLGVVARFTFWRSEFERSRAGLACGVTFDFLSQDGTEIVQIQGASFPDNSTMSWERGLEILKSLLTFAHLDLETKIYASLRRLAQINDP